MSSKPKNRNIFKIILIINFILLAIFAGYLLFTKFGFKEERPEPKYLSSIDNKVAIYDKEYKKAFELYRGTKVDIYKDIITNNDIKYYELLYDDIKYLVEVDNVVDDYQQSIKESELFVRTPVTVYKEDAYILGFIPKGNSISIIGFDKMDDGVVNKYKIKYEEEEGYIYSKYLVDTKDEALENYNENGTYDIHKNRKFSYELYGGYAKNLDYYPYEKAKLKNNDLLEDAHTLYLNGSSSVLDNVDKYIELAKESNINAFVVDIKDGNLSYKSEIAKEYSKTSYDKAVYTVDNYKKIIAKLKDNGFYVIGRIVAFNDSLFASDNPEEAISKNGSPTSWVSAYSRKAWEYNVLLGTEAVNLFGFNEIQYDYVRFPETAYSMSKSSAYDFKNKYGEEKGQAIQNFIFYATDMLHEANAYISVDVFGESSNTYVTAYGQYWPAISNIVDVISAMPYPDHFNKYEYGFKSPVWTIPYDLLKTWGASAVKRQSEIPTPAIARTWIQAYDALYEPKVKYDADMVSKEIKALYDVGLNGGYITWNAGSNYNKYKNISAAFKKEYR